METNTLKKWGMEWQQDTGKSGLNWSVEHETADFLYGFVRMVKPIRLLEIGTFEGTSATAIGQALKKNGKGHLWTIDIKDYGQGKNIKEYKLNNIVTCLIGHAQTTLKLKEDGLFDFVFIDDGHSYENATRDLNICNSLIKQFGYILGHDIMSALTVKQAFDNFIYQNKDKYEKIILGSYAGLFILKKTHV